MKKKIINVVGSDKDKAKKDELIELLKETFPGAVIVEGYDATIELMKKVAAKKQKKKK